jgi:hypothetical protein
MWPAMWPGYPNPGAVFFLDDDGANQKLAEEYGIVMSTSHHEPMQRATTEWFLDNPDGSWDWLTNRDKITKFFEEGARRAEGCETYFTLGMRGEYDRKMVTDDPTAVVRDVIATQRSILGDVYGIPSKPRRKCIAEPDTSSLTKPYQSFLPFTRRCWSSLKAEDSTFPRMSPCSLLMTIMGQYDASLPPKRPREQVAQV